MDKSELSELVEQGLPVREIAAQVSRSQSNVRYWIKRHGLPQPIEVRNRAAKSAQLEGKRTVTGRCRTHGETVFVIENSGRRRCRACRMQRVADWRRRTKLRLVEEAGGVCVTCGYDRSAGALHFHHLDPAEKSFGLGVRGITRSIADLRAEAAKCVLLCANCHAEVEAGVTELPG